MAQMAQPVRQLLRAWGVEALGRYTHDDEGHRWTAVRYGSVFLHRYVNYGDGPTLEAFRWWTLERSARSLDDVQESV